MRLWRSWLAAPIVGALLSVPLAAPLYAAPSPLISSCTTITSPGAYVVTSDITAASTDLVCIDIKSNGVTLVLGGHTVTGSIESANNDVGILIEPQATGATVVNGTVTGFGFGIFAAASGAKIQLVTADDNFIGILMGVVESTTPISGNTIAHAQVNDNVWVGIALFNTINSVVASSSANDNGLDGIVLGERTSQDRLSANTANNNLDEALAPVKPALRATLAAVIPIANSQDSANIFGNGIADFGTQNTIAGNTVSNNDNDGIVVFGTQNSILGNHGSNDGNFDLFDDNTNCDSNTWLGNSGTRNLLPANTGKLTCIG